MARIPDMAAVFDKPLPEGADAPGEFTIQFGIGGGIDLGVAFGDTLFGFDIEGDNLFGIGAGAPGGAFEQGGLPLNESDGVGAILGF